MPDERGMPLDTDVCHCGVLMLDHTIRQLREHHPAESLNLPYEESTEPTWTTTLDAHGDLAAAIVCKAGVMQFGRGGGFEGGALPALGLHLFGLDGRTTVAKALLVLTPDKMRGVG